MLRHGDVRVRPPFDGSDNGPIQYVLVRPAAKSVRTGVNGPSAHEGEALSKRDGPSTWLCRGLLPMWGGVWGQRNISPPNPAYDPAEVVGVVGVVAFEVEGKVHEVRCAIDNPKSEEQGTNVTARGTKRGQSRNK